VNSLSGISTDPRDHLDTFAKLIDDDLLWNPSWIEQRLGRIKRFGQTRQLVDMLNLVYPDNQGEKVYNVLSDRRTKRKIISHFWDAELAKKEGKAVCKVVVKSSDKPSSNQVASTKLSKAKRNGKIPS
jgi:hypothetical protein